MIYRTSRLHLVAMVASLAAISLLGFAAGCADAGAAGIQDDNQAAPAATGAEAADNSAKVEVEAAAAGDGEPNVLATVRPGTEAGQYVLTINGQDLPLKGPGTRQIEVTPKVPGNYYPEVENWHPWPSRGRGGAILAVGLAPRHDEQGTPILGALYCQTLPDTLKLTSADGATVYKRDEDYRLREDWQQIMNIDGRLGQPGEGQLLASYQAKLQRIDLVARDQDDKLSVFEGQAVLVCPAPPEAPAGSRVLATIYWPGTPTVTTTQQWQTQLPLVLKVGQSQPVQPINPQAVAATLKKLRAGDTVRIAFVGDSVTLGAEAGKWWEDDAPHYRNQMLAELRRRFPRATIEEIKAFQGGKGAQFGVEILQERVLGKNVDLLLIAFGLNDAIAPVGGKPSNPPEAFGRQITGMIQKAREEDIEVMLLTPMQPSPFQKEGLATRIADYNKVLKETAASEGVALADVYTQWLRLEDRGIPPYSQLHNWLNHPGILGHGVYAEVILRFFPARDR